MFIFNFFSELMIVIVILNISPVSLLFIQESFQVLESVVYEEQENTNQGVKACLLFFYTGYQKSSAVGICVT